MIPGQARCAKVPAPHSTRRHIISSFLARPDVLRLLLTALGALLVLWQRLLVPVLLGLLVYAWSCLLADRLGPSRLGRAGWARVAGLAGPGCWRGRSFAR